MKTINKTLTILLCLILAFSCACVFSDCQDNTEDNQKPIENDPKPTEDEHKHTFNDLHECEECGAVVGTYIGVRDELYHLMLCSDCGELISKPHDCTDEHACTVCEYTIHEHDFSIVTQANVDEDTISPDEHIVTCSVCGLTDIEAHDFEHGDNCSQCGAVRHYHHWELVEEEIFVNIHGLYCTECGGYTWEEHSFVEGSDECSVCGAPPHTHNYEFIETSKTNETQHQVYCEECGAAGWQKHVYSDDGTCEVCGYHK